MDDMHNVAVKARNREHSLSSPDLTNDIIKSEAYSLQKRNRESQRHLLLVEHEESQESIPRNRKNQPKPFVLEDNDSKSQFSDFSEMKGNLKSPVLPKSPNDV